MKYGFGAGKIKSFSIENKLKKDKIFYWNIARIRKKQEWDS